MANTLAPFGFQPIRRLDGASWDVNQSVRKIASANTNKFYKGDVVKSLSTGYIDVAGASDTQIVGVFVGCRYFSVAQQRTVWSPYFPGGDVSADVEAYIIDDPMVLFIAQTGGGSGAALGIAAIGNNIKLTTATAGNAQSGISGMALDDGNVNTTSTFPFRVVDIPNVQTSGGAVGTAGGAIGNGYDPTTKYNVAIVAFNSQDFKSTTGI